MTEPPPFFPGFDSLEHFLSAIIDSSDDAIITKNLDGIVTSWNRAAERIFGYAAQEMVGRPIALLIPEERQDEEPMILRRLRRGDRVDHFDTKRVRKNGEIVEIALTISPVKNQAGEVVGASKIARDITVQKKAAQAIVAATEEIARQSRMKDEFLATLSHELRTPLQSILGWVQLLRADRLDPVELAHGLEVIDRNAQAQQHIIDDLLDMNRILSGKVRLDVQRLNLGAVVNAAVEITGPSALVKNIQLHAVLDPLSHLVLGDPQRLQQVFWNLLNNAVKFTPRGGRVQVFMQRVNSHIEVSITDTGAGINNQFLPYVFDRFRQADASSTRSQGGLGLGLALVKSLVELHGGSVVAQSPGINLGSTFSVHLPVAALNELDSSHSSPSFPTEGQSSRSPVQQLQGIEVLVVDDDKDSRDLIARTLAKSGATVRTADGADEGFRLLSESLPDVLVSDIGMPGTDGYAFVERLRAQPDAAGGKIPAVALTAYTRVEDRVRALCAGFQILLPKPADAGELLATVASLAKRSKNTPSPMPTPASWRPSI